MTEISINTLQLLQLNAVFFVHVFTFAAMLLCYPSQQAAKTFISVGQI